MTRNILVLGGTSEASQLAEALAARGMRATLSYAGRVAAPKVQPLPVRIGGFGGADGLATYLRTERITHLVDATHPFAAVISANAVQAATAAGVPLVALVRPPWRAQAGDLWRIAPDAPAAAQALAGPPKRVFLAIGRQQIAAFAGQPQHHYLLRLVDPPAEALPLPRAMVVIARGPFDVDGDAALMRDHRIDVVVAKNAGGAGASAKLAAARALGISVILIDRPAALPRTEVDTVAGVLHWLAHGSAANLGV